MKRWQTQRIVLGPRVVPMVLTTTFLFVVFIIPVWPHRREAGNILGEGMLWGVLALATGVAYLSRHFMGFMVELDGARLTIRPHGYFWRAHHFALTEVKCVEPWREDLREDIGIDQVGPTRGRNTSPRLHVQFHDGSGLLFGPWVTGNAQNDFDRLRLALGSLFCGDAQLENRAVEGLDSF